MLGALLRRVNKDYRSWTAVFARRMRIFDTRDDLDDHRAGLARPCCLFAITRAISVRAIAPAKWLLAGHRDLLFEADDARPRSLFGRRCLRGGRSSESFQQCHDG